MQLLLDAGADPTIPAGDKSPLNHALNGGHLEIAALLRRSIDVPIERARVLAKARMQTFNQGERLRGVVACVVGLEGPGLSDDVFKELLTGYLVPHQSKSWGDLYCIRVL